MAKLIVFCFLTLLLVCSSQIIVNTWPFTNATAHAYSLLLSGTGVVDAIVSGCGVCETMQCDGSVGFGGSPDEFGETELDAMVMDGMTMEVGGVGSIRYIKNAVGVALAVMRHTSHTLLVGDQATEFAVEMGFKKESLTTPASTLLWEKWVNNSCQPNFRVDVTPNPATSCGPYNPLPSKHYKHKHSRPFMASRQTHGSSKHEHVGHDTIAMIGIDSKGNIASATSTNGLSHKVAGRVGDSPIAGAGSYAVKGIGGCGGTGDGDIHLRFLPCYQAVENLRLGMSPTEAAENAMRRMMAFYPVFQGALVVVNINGEHGGACTGWTFKYSVQSPTTKGVEVYTVLPLQV